MTWHPQDQLSERELLVPELMARVQQIHLRTHRLVNTALSGGYRSTFRGGGIEFEEVRPYQPGDEVRRIDWNVTARNDEAFVKSFREERQLSVHFLVDTSLTMDFGSKAYSKRELAAQFTALLALVALRHQDRVGLTLFGSNSGLHLPCKKGKNHVMRLIREVIAARPDRQRSDLRHALENHMRAEKTRAMVFVISDFLGDDDPMSWSDAMAGLNARHDVIAVRVVDPFEERLPKAGMLRIRELGTNRETEIDTRSKKVRELWEREASERRVALHRALSRARVDQIEIQTDKDVSGPVMRFFRRRELRHAGRIA